MTVRKPWLFGTGILRTYGVTIKHFFMKSLTVQYPRARTPIADISRGMLQMRGAIDTDTGFVPAFSEMPPCQERCPGNVDARGYIGLVAQGRYDDAYELHLEHNPLPGIVSRICPHPCERACRRGEEDAAVTICDLKGFMFDNTSAGRRQKIFSLPKERKEKKVAVVGAGPAGLSVAFWLGKCGYDVVIFERLPVGGGIVREAIAPARLPADIIDQEVEDIRKMCVAIRTNTPVGPDGLSLDDLFAKDFGAVFLGIGAHRKVPAKGKDKDKAEKAAPEPTRAEKNAWLPEQGVDLDEQGNIAVAPGTNQTSRAGVFAGGEAILGPGVAITTIGCARRAARAIDVFLNGSLSDYWENGFSQMESIKSRYDEDTPRPARAKPGEEPATKGFTEKQAIAQAERCLSCMTEQCIGCHICEKYCPPRAIKVTTSQDKTRRIDAYEVDYGKCQLCETCVDVCPTRTLTHTPEFETGDYGRVEMIYGKDKMLRTAVLREDKYARHPKKIETEDAS